MIACVWPDSMVRSTPLRISSAAPSTDTCRSRISRVDTVFSALQSDEDVVALDLGLVDGYGNGRGQAGRLAGAQVEAGAVQPALHGGALDVALGQRHVLVRADVADREHLALGVHQAHRLVTELDPDGRTVRDVGERAGPVPGLRPLALRALALAHAPTAMSS